jgi:Tfp pilus assembly protein PilF
MYRAVWILAWTAALALGAVSATPTTSPTSPTTRKAELAASFIASGMNALLAHDAKAARDAFDDALRLDPGNTLASQGLGIAYLQLSSPKRAVKYLQPLAGRAGNDGALAINYAAACVAMKEPMPGAKVLREYMQSNPGDEEAATALQVSLNAAQGVARQSRFYADATTFLSAYLDKLGASHPGQKRWGDQWVPADQADQKAQTLAAAQQHIEQIHKEQAAAERQITALQSEIAATRRTGHTLEHLDQLRNKLHEAQNARDAKKTELAKATAAMPSAPIADQIAPVPIVGTARLASASMSPPSAPAMAIATTRPAAANAAGANVSVQVAALAHGGGPRIISRNAVAFAIAPNLLITSADVVAGASEIRLKSSDGTDVIQAKVDSLDEASGLALLKVEGKKLPCLALADKFPSGAISCVGFPQVALFTSGAQTIAGTLQPSGAASFSQHPRLAGAPLLSRGQVAGVELASRDDEPSAIPIATLAQIQKLIGDRAGAEGAATASPPSLAVLELTTTREVE